jgi:ubiquinone/menaquinone biosynthesis C-methylase UbiE
MSCDLTPQSASNRTAFRNVRAVSYDLAVRLRDAVEMLSESDAGSLGPTTWADLGCGTGTFTLALADLLSPGSAIHAIDRDASALRSIPTTHKEVRITTHRGDFTKHEWPFDKIDGILMANSLHYVEDQKTFIRRCQSRMTMPRRFMIVEYDLDKANRWVPCPVSRVRLTSLFIAAGYSSIKMLGSRPSVYRRAPLYAALITGLER